jgi:hypothetical protein
VKINSVSSATTVVLRAIGALVEVISEAVSCVVIPLNTIGRFLSVTILFFAATAHALENLIELVVPFFFLTVSTLSGETIILIHNLNYNTVYQVIFYLLLHVYKYHTNSGSSQTSKIMLH